MSPVLETPLCTLRPWRAEDAESLAELANDIDVWRNLRDGFPHPYTAADARAFLALTADAAPATFLAIEVDGRAVGGTGLHRGSDIERLTAELGYWLGRPYWGRGVTTAAVRSLTEHGLGALELERVFAVPFEHNVASHRVLEKSGFVLEGTMRRSAIKEGRVLDQRLYARTRA